VEKVAKKFFFHIMLQETNKTG